MIFSSDYKTTNCGEYSQRDVFAVGLYPSEYPPNNFVNISDNDPRPDRMVNMNFTFVRMKPSFAVSSDYPILTQGQCKIISCHY